MRTTSLVIPVLVLSVFASGCATQSHGFQGAGAGWEPVIDVRPEQQGRYRQDVYECQMHATKVMDAATTAAQGAVAGALFGALLGAAAGGKSYQNRQLAGVGALTAGTHAGVAGEVNQRSITRNCLIGRGYAPLN